MLPRRAGIGVSAVLNRLAPTCLEGAFVRQQWLAHQGECRDVVIGLPPSGFGKTAAHAWVDGTDEASARQYIELHRVPPLATGLRCN